MQYNPVPTEKDYEIAARNGISKANVNQRVYGYHWSVERAITEPLQNKKGKENNRHLVCIAEKMELALLLITDGLEKKE